MNYTQQQCPKSVEHKENSGLEEILRLGYTVLAGSVLGAFGGIAFSKVTQKHCGCVETDIPQPSRFPVTPGSQRGNNDEYKVVKPALAIRKTKRLGNLEPKREREPRSQYEILS